MLAKLAFFLVFILAVAWEVFVFLNFPQQAFVQGLVESWFVSKGLFFYKDFAGTYMPFLRLLMVPYHAAFGYTQQATMLLAPLFSIATLAVLAYASVKYLTSWARFVPIIFFVSWNQFIGENHFTTTTFLGFLVLVTLLFWWSFFKKPQRIKLLFLGMLSGFCLLTLQLMASLVGVILVSVVFKAIKDRGWSKNLAYYFIGFLFPIVAILAIMTINGALPAFYYWTVVYHLTDYPYAGFGKTTQDTLTFFSIHSPLALLGFIGYYNIFKKDYSASLQLFFLLLALLVLAVSFWFALFHPLRFQITLPAISFAFGIALQQVIKIRPLFRLLGLVLVVAIIWFNFKNIYEYVLPRYEGILLDPPERQIVSWLYEDDPMYRAVVWIKQNTPPESRIFVLGDILFYFESERLISHARGASNIPFYFQSFDLFLEEILQKPPDYWVIDERDFRRFKEFEYGHLVDPFQKLLNCQEEIARFDYWVVRKQVSLDPSCLSASRLETRGTWGV